MPPSDALADEVARLYALAAEEFTAARNATVKAWKRAGRTGEAAAIAALRRPSVLESALNHTAHRDPTTTAAWADATRRAEDAQSATFGGADASALRAAVAELRTATAALVDAAVATIGDPSKRNDIAALLRSVPTGAAHQVVAGVLGSAARADDDVFAGAPTPPARARPTPRVGTARPERTSTEPVRRATSTAPAKAPRTVPPVPPVPPVQPVPSRPSARQRTLEATVARRRAVVADLDAERDAAQGALDEARRRLDGAELRRSDAARALAEAEDALRADVGTEP